MLQQVLGLGNICEGLRWSGGRGQQSWWIGKCYMSVYVELLLATVSAHSAADLPTLTMILM